MAIAKTGFSAKTPENFVIDAAVIYTGVTYDAVEGWTGTLMGATSGGVAVNFERSTRKIEVDGTYMTPVKGLTRNENQTCKIAYTTKELTAEAIRRALNGEVAAADAAEAPTGYQKITSKWQIEDTDYLGSVAVFGIHSGTGQPIVFVIDNGLVTSNAEIQTEDNNEAGIEQEITAHANYAQVAAQELPWRIYHPEATV